MSSALAPQTAASLALEIPLSRKLERAFTPAFDVPAERPSISSKIAGVKPRSFSAAS